MSLNAPPGDTPLKVALLDPDSAGVANAVNMPMTAFFTRVQCMSLNPKLTGTDRSHEIQSTIVLETSGCFHTAWPIEKLLSRVGNLDGSNAS